MPSLLTLSATQIAALIRRGEVTSRQAVDAHIAQIQKVNPALNAVVRYRFDEARREADAADQRVAEGAGELPPFLGVPCTIKEAFALTGMPNTAGLVARRGLAVTEDAVAVQRLRAAGAIPLGVTNTSELCMWMESDNRVYGRTNNPYDLRRTVGGSSGGEGAIIGAGGSPFGLGSDVGGSIRMPAFFNGVFGHKPSGGLVDNAGQFPSAPEGLRTHLTTGPLARRAEDLAPLLRVLAGEQASSVGDPASVDLSKLRVVTVADNASIRVSSALRAVQEQVVRALARRGARVVRASVPGFANSLEIWTTMMAGAHGPSFSSLLGEGTPIRAGRELARWAVGRSEHTFPAIGLALFEELVKLQRGRGRMAAGKGKALRREVEELVGAGGVMLFPSYPTTAPRHGRAVLSPFRWVYTAIFNVLEMPVTQVPLGRGRRGLPLGVQVVGMKGEDRVTLAVAAALEKEFGGWVAPRMAGLG